ncbi:glycosyltransferase family 2 [Trichoderma cornu-damae]|uniref:Glycosyltransferase family 2 n=1 Tax=Trichoderma cornu-damae TaxID=654480 RepID=A0A9P8QJR4_9HYPO|nr:glycosyltransferase family 2 [Trichoderma cornu-damae]
MASTVSTLEPLSINAFQDGPVPHIVTKGRHTSWFRVLLNVIGGLVSIPAYWAFTVHCRYPVTLDLLLTILLTELNRLVNHGRRVRFYEEECPRPPQPPRDETNGNGNGVYDEKKASLLEAQSVPRSRLDSMAAVVGWREDPALFTRALESYKSARHCTFMLVGIDGDDAADDDMVDVFKRVYPNQSKIIHVPQPLGEVAEQLVAKHVAACKRNGRPVDMDGCYEAAMRRCFQLARAILEQEKVDLGSVRHICLRQRHMYKKAIMFTTFVFALVIADALGIEFLWSSDSDTLVLPGSIHGTMDAIAQDPTIGGASTGLVVHNGRETAVTKLSATVYWGELYLTRSIPASTATSDCQSGPSTAFRLAAMPAMLIPWYLQTLLGKRMIINEDRALTTNLLLRGWGVAFASDVLTATDTPTTLARWLKQQVRWARATHIESLLQPKVYLVTHPLFFYSMSRRELGPVVALAATLWYLATGEQLIILFMADLLVRFAVRAAYNVLRNPHRLDLASVKWIVPGILFYQLPLPAVHVWSLLTLTADGWGTSMRNSSELAKKDGARQAWREMGFFVAWMGVVAGCVARWLSTFLGLADGEMLAAMAVSSAAAAGAAWRFTVYEMS